MTAETIRPVAAPPWRYRTGAWGWWEGEAVMLHGTLTGDDAYARAVSVMAWEWGIDPDGVVVRLMIDPCLRWRNVPCSPNWCGEHRFHWQEAMGDTRPGAYDGRLVYVGPPTRQRRPQRDPDG